MSTAGADLQDQVNIPCDALYTAVYNTCLRYIDADDSRFIADKIVLAEKMGVASHGLHYFLHALLPLLKDGNINRPVTTIRGNVVHAEGTGGVGFMALEDCLHETSIIAHEHGIGLACIKTPGKVGALRVYCQKYMGMGQLVIMLKNTARTMGMTGPVFGTNPLCMGLPNTDFIYDSSMSTIATNKLRVAAARGEHFPDPVGVGGGEYTANPEKVLAGDGYLLPFSDAYWYKSFFLSMAIEGMAAMAGGKTGARVGRHKDDRLYSQEGMVCILIDAASFPYYDNYLKEIKLLTKDTGLRLPGAYKEKKTCRVLARNWQEIGGRI